MSHAAARLDIAPDRIEQPTRDRIRHRRRGRAIRRRDGRLRPHHGQVPRPPRAVVHPDVHVATRTHDRSTPHPLALANVPAIQSGERHDHVEVVDPRLDRHHSSPSDITREAHPPIERRAHDALRRDHVRATVPAALEAPRLLVAVRLDDREPRPGQQQARARRTSRQRCHGDEQDDGDAAGDPKSMHPSIVAPESSRNPRASSRLRLEGHPKVARRLTRRRRAPRSPRRRARAASHRGTRP